MDNSAGPTEVPARLFRQMVAALANHRHQAGTYQPPLAKYVGPPVKLFVEPRCLRLCEARNSDVQ